MGFSDNHVFRLSPPLEGFEEKLEGCQCFTEVGDLFVESVIKYRDDMGYNHSFDVLSKVFSSRVFPKYLRDMVYRTSAKV